MNQGVRLEHDSMGEIEVPSNALWGAQTQRALINFELEGDKIPIKLIYALAKIKKAAATINNRLGELDDNRCSLIIKAASEIEAGSHDQHFPLPVWQTGSGTQTNMNINEVISNLSAQASGEALGSKKPVHPNDHVNKSQSTNDTFPAAIHMATVESILKDLLPELHLLIDTLSKKSNQWSDIVKIGRTHLQDAVPLTLGQEVSGWREQLIMTVRRLQLSLKELYPLPLGGTAIGTGLNTPAEFDIKIVEELTKLTDLPFTTADNKFAVMSSHDSLVNAMSQIKLLAVVLLKLVNDIRLLSCGPRAGIAELILPANEPGSSIMPGKVNPTQCEAMSMICTQVIGLDTAVAMAGSGGHLQMNVYKPLIAFNILHSIELLTGAIHNCRVHMIEGIEPNREKIKADLENSLMLVTALAPKIGYEAASKIAQYAHEKKINLKEAAIKSGNIQEADFNRLVDPYTMTRNRRMKE